MRQTYATLSDDAVSCIVDDRLELLLMPTEACNFRCTYCYEDFALRRMAPEIVRGVKALMRSRADDVDSLHLGWFGGEPLLAMDIVEDVMSQALALTAGRPRLQVIGSMSTNAFTLSRERFQRLLELRVTEYQITFDGPRRWHNRKRLLANGTGTFDRIWTNLLAMRRVREDFRVTVRLHIDRENHRDMPSFIRRCARSFRGDERFRFFVRPTTTLGGANDANLPILPPRDATEISAELGRLIVSLGLLSHTKREDPEVCYAARGNSFLVRADGRINKCTVALEHPNNQVGRLHPDGTLELDNRKTAAWMRGVWTGDVENLRCPMNGLADPSPVPVVRTAAGNG